MADTKAYIGLGSNLGDRESYINKALKMITCAEQVELCRVSDIIETVALSSTEQPKFLNVVAEIETTLSPAGLHKMLTGIENGLGRTRRGQWWPRTIDLDMLLFGEEILEGLDLTVPHPQMHLRSFVLKGLCQLNGEQLHPVMKVPFDELNARLNGCDFALDPDKPQLVSIAGNIGVGKTTLAKKLADRLGCEVLLEPYDENPFLADVYAGKKELALDSQLYFLTSRARQLDPEKLEAGKICISDYVFDKELIYAKRLLNAQQLALYEKIYPPFAAQVTAPALVIYMHDPAQNCLERIHSRNRPYEQQIELQFLRNLDSDYERLFERWKSCPVIRISTSQSMNADSLVNQIKYYTAGNFIVANSQGQSKI
ncbi:MAG: 2-amino-4-hydroxy-6-hydroxymethyldihydropteridine diphosphokinase [Planctomycetes bacterium RBG_13_50_24]|nr:MAG: 2-amino-4-hydroxy-6-hydroxymethyldihydropteridine diphosphokinase [Planctomycetes bacterium RBG_13_50_24]